MLLTDKSIHVLSTIPPPDSLNGEKIKELRQLLIQNEIIEEKSEGLPDKQLVRYLIARNYDVKKSYDLFMVAFNWRQLRKPDELEMIDGWGNRMGRESETGKSYVQSGRDKFGRPVIVLDNSVQNSPDGPMQIDFLAWILELAIREMPADCDKYLIFVHLENFTLMNNPSMATVRETLKMLSECYPERLGHLILYKPPFVFKAVFEAIKMFLDIKTSSKLLFLYGDDSDGSDNDTLMKHVVGDEWKTLTGAGQPVLVNHSSPGYDHSIFWPRLLERVNVLQEREAALKGLKVEDMFGIPMESTPDTSTWSFKSNSSASSSPSPAGMKKSISHSIFSAFSSDKSSPRNFRSGSLSPKRGAQK